MLSRGKLLVLLARDANIRKMQMANSGVGGEREYDLKS